MRRIAPLLLVVLAAGAAPAAAAGPALSVTASAVPNPTIAGGNITYLVSVRNVGDAATSAVTLSTTIPAGATFVTLGPPPGWTCTAPAVGAGGAVSCTLPSIGASDEHQFGYTIATGQFPTDRTMTSSFTAATTAGQSATTDASTTVRGYVDPVVKPPDPKPPTVVIIGGDPTAQGQRPQPTVTPVNGVTCPSVPKLVGKRLAAARRALERAGCTMPLRVRGKLRRRNVVTAQSAKPGSKLSGTRTLTLRIN